MFLYKWEVSPWESKLVLRISEFNPAFNMQDRKYNPVLNNNEQDSIFNRLKEDIDRLETKTNETSKQHYTEQTLLYALSPLPPVRLNLLF